ncbi:hypothetical protein EDD86DRAFT_214874 [Gorgonomyces haynaldii]|nr:hypothetical protein EDD86DRAFT_214874 [Gorgonomyces haynaldii]
MPVRGVHGEDSRVVPFSRKGRRTLFLQLVIKCGFQWTLAQQRLTRYFRQFDASHFPMAPIKCSNAGCNDRAVKIVGDCRYCSSKFCAKHRLPEAHACPNLESCRQSSKDTLTNKLLQEKTVVTKV